MPVADTTYLCGAGDLTSREGYGGRLAGGVVLLSGAGTAEFLITAVNRDAAYSSVGQPISVRYLGEGYGIAGGTLAAGNRLQTDGTGRWIVATTGMGAVALALENATVGEGFNLLMEAVGYAYPEP